MNDTNRQVTDRLQRGLRLQQQGRLAQATDIYEEAVRRFPGHADALYLYGMALYQAGKGKPAADFLAEAVEKVPGHAAFHCGLGLAQQSIGHTGDAILSFKRAVELDPSSFEARYNLGVALLRTGQANLAVAHFERAVELQPDLPDVRFTLAHTMENLGHLGGAAEQYRRILETDPNQVEAMVQLARLPGFIVSVEEAFSHVRKAVELAPDHVPALLSFAAHLETRNRLDEAREAIERVRRISPGEVRADILMATIDFRQGNYEAARRLLEDVVGRADAPLGDLVSANHQLGLVLDRLEDFENAFAAITRSNALAADSQIARIIEKDYYPQRIDALKRWCQTSTRRDRAAAPIADECPPDPVFFVGFPRSGTTLVEQILDAHPRLHTSGEFAALSNTIAAMPELTGIDLPYPGALDSLKEEDIGRLRTFYWQSCAETIGLPGEGQRLVDKLPLNIVDLAFVQTVFPQAQILTALRDPRDVCLSCLMQNFALTNAMIHFLSLEDTARFYVKVMELWQTYRDTLTLPMFAYRYEDLVVDFEGTVRDIIGFLELPWDDAMLGYRERAGRKGIATPSYRDVASPLYTRAVGRWRKYENQLAPALPVLDPCIDAFGYRSA